MFLTCLVSTTKLTSAWGIKPRNCRGRIFVFHLMQLHKPKLKKLQNVTWKLEGKHRT